MSEFTQALARDGINVVLRQNAHGDIYGITYVDFKSKCVFNGSDLGKEFSAKGILDKIEANEQKQTINLVQKTDLTVTTKEEKGFADEIKKLITDPWVDLTRAIEQENYIPWQFREKKKKKQSKGISM